MRERKAAVSPGERTSGDQLERSRQSEAAEYWALAMKSSSQKMLLRQWLVVAGRRRRMRERKAAVNPGERTS
ncbi:MAG: hypothetical protein AAFR70_15695, partial [Pseudomonadota bacterium]